MKSMNEDYKTRWKKLSSPKDGNYNGVQYHQSNLWFIKDVDGCFGILIGDTLLPELDKVYKNIKTTKHDEQNFKGKKVKNCLAIIHSVASSNEIFFDTIIGHLSQNVKLIFTPREMQDVLNKIAELLKQESSELNEITGVFGELFLLRFLLKKCKKKNIYHIINSWEKSTNSRAYIDFVLESFKLKIEVKSTIKDTRQHKFSYLDQLHVEKTWSGYLASIGLKIDEGGATCEDVLLEISNMITNQECIDLLKEKIKNRGKSLCKNTKYKFIENNNMRFKFFSFATVRQPTLPVNGGIEKIEWVANCDNISNVFKGTVTKNI